MCMEHDHHGGHGPSDKNLPVAMQEKWPDVLREIAHMVAHIKDVRLRANPEPLPPELDHVKRNPVILNMLKAALMEDKPGLKRPVAQRMASKIGDYFLWNRATSMPVIHELGTLSAWWVDHMPLDVIHTVRDVALDLVLNGTVMPVQEVWEDIMDSELMYIGHCVCRSSGIANDLKDASGEVFTLTTPRESHQLLNRLMNRYDALIREHGSLPDTHSQYADLFATLKYYKETKSPMYRLETLLERTWPAWEFLPVLPKFTQAWIRGMHKNRKTHQIHKTLAFEMANIFYLARGSMFTSMKIIDTPYTICTCPTPETGGGCTLTNWYYYGQSNTSLIPGNKAFGRRENKKGETLHCNQFPARGSRECVGCGCKHASKAPRSVGTVLRQADQTLTQYGVKKPSQIK